MPATNIVSTQVRTHGLALTEHEVTVPLDHADPGGELITVFAREVADPGDTAGTDKPYLVYLQGGPGHEAPRPTRHPSGPAWLERALKEYRVLMLDQRGTGRSTPVGDPVGETPEQQADYLKHFRADSIVRDAELVREALGGDKWSVTGQSFGGFCVLSYLSLAPEGLREAFFTGGVPPVGGDIDDIYRKTYERVVERTRRYYERYPADRDRVLEIHSWLENEDVRLPCGDRLTSRRFRQLGHGLGMSDGAERLHYLVELPKGSRAFLHDVEAAEPFSRNPLYAVVHESSYADGQATRWSAERTLPELPPEGFTGEHVYPWMFTEYGALAPWREAAELLAQHEWPKLYDAERLAENEVPAAAAIFAEDAYVEAEYSMETVSLVRGLRPWLTNEYEHNAMRADGGRVLDRLIDLARGRA
ncbi:alpha/beta fold hydrolase [Amycolatopsis minnesotensis]|uniref:Alpha/beta fold hydrolase n=1 Tax=Amycolatopsis minnesotensis TaxID=337894 RepID=A0ABN2SQF1_9PSEU